MFSQRLCSEGVIHIHTHTQHNTQRWWQCSRRITPWRVFNRETFSWKEEVHRVSAKQPPQNPLHFPGDDHRIELSAPPRPVYGSTALLCTKLLRILLCPNRFMQTTKHTQTQTAITIVYKVCMKDNMVGIVIQSAIATSEGVHHTATYYPRETKFRFPCRQPTRFGFAPCHSVKRKNQQTRRDVYLPLSIHSSPK